MKKSISILISLLLIFSLCACGGSDASEAEAEAEAEAEVEAVAEEEAFQPVTTEYSTLQEVNESIGMSLCHPGVMGIQDISCSTTEYEDYTVGKYIFSAYGLEYTFLASPAFDAELTGIEPAPFSCENSGKTQFASVTDMKIARWINMDGQYVLMVKDSGSMEQDTFAAIADELATLTFPGWLEEDYIAYYSSLEGNYYDLTSQRAMAEAVANGAESLNLTVTWSSSAAEHYEWKMNLVRGEDGLLYYTDCVKTLVTFVPVQDVETDTSVTSEEEAEDTVNYVEERTVEYENGCGFFSESEGVLYWNGAEEEGCVDCAFEIYYPDAVQ